MQPHKDGEQRIPPRGDAGSASRLVEAVRTFRIVARIDLGDVERDVADYIKKVSPPNNRFPKRSEVEPPRIKSRPLIERIRDRIAVIGQDNPRLLIDDEAEARAAVCHKCPQNVRWMTGCVPCCAEIKSRGINLRQKPKAPESIDTLSACRLHNFYLPAFVYIDRDELGPVHESAPEFCWMRSESHLTFDKIEGSSAQPI